MTNIKGYIIMKKLYIKQKLFKITDQYSVLDENQNIIYNVDEEFKFVGKKFNVSDSSGKEVFFVSKILFNYLPQYEICFADGNKVQVKSRLTYFKKQIDIITSGENLMVLGNFGDSEFSIQCGDDIVGKIKKEYLSLGDTFEISVYDESKQDLILGVLIAIDSIKDHDDN